MNKISVGEYVRLKNGEIAKIEKCYGKDIGYKNMGHYHIDIYSDTFNGFTIYKEDILKHSKNIIDLIEEGDYVNGVRILDITGDYIHTAEWDCCKARLENKLHSIVTKEKYKEMEYRL